MKNVYLIIVLISQAEATTAWESKNQGSCICHLGERLSIFLFLVD
jgi:hypothetical protein